MQVGSIAGAFAETERQNARYAESQADDAGQDRYNQEIHVNKLRRSLLAGRTGFTR
ncbi:hypothetical protein GCM10009700_01000 [Brevibacterium sanguinis]